MLAASADTTIGRLMDQNPPAVGAETDQEIAARVMLDHGEGSLAVVDDDGAFLGIIAPKKILAVLMQEHDEDLRFSGLLATARRPTPRPPAAVAGDRTDRGDGFRLARRLLGGTAHPYRAARVLPARDRLHG